MALDHKLIHIKVCKICPWYRNRNEITGQKNHTDGMVQIIQQNKLKAITEMGI